jgi:predicted NAD-dependent protein-ADP-ribosyltransferase YbiA (DUF1768 family)
MGNKTFSGELGYLSNFYPCKVKIYGEEYPSVENGYQAAKSSSPAERDLFKGISAAEARKLGKRLTLRQGWEETKLAVMEHARNYKRGDCELFPARLLMGKPMATVTNQPYALTPKSSRDTELGHI